VLLVDVIAPSPDVLLIVAAMFPWKACAPQEIASMSAHNLGVVLFKQQFAAHKQARLFQAPA
jgi:hypothetical protein